MLNVGRFRPLVAFATVGGAAGVDFVLAISESQLRLTDLSFGQIGRVDR